MVAAPSAARVASLQQAISAFIAAPRHRSCLRQNATITGVSSTTLILAALRDELSPAARRLNLNWRADHFAGSVGDAPVVAAVIGMGAARAGPAAQRAIAENRPGRVILVGFSGALSPALKVGDIVRPQWVRNAQGETLRLGSSQASAPRVADPAECASALTLLTSDHLVCDPTEKRRLGNVFRAAIVDMESFAVAEAARQAGVPLTVVRAVSDDADTALPPRMADWVNADGSPSVLRATLALLRRPMLLPVLLKMRKHTQRAARQLAEEVAGELAASSITGSP